MAKPELEFRCPDIQASSHFRDPSRESKAPIPVPGQAASYLEAHCPAAVHIKESMSFGDVCVARDNTTTHLSLCQIQTTKKPLGALTPCCKGVPAHSA